MLLAIVIGVGTPGKCDRIAEGVLIVEELRITSYIEFEKGVVLPAQRNDFLDHSVNLGNQNIIWRSFVPVLSDQRPS